MINSRCVGSSPYVGTRVSFYYILKRQEFTLDLPLFIQKRNTTHNYYNNLKRIHDIIVLQFKIELNL